MDQSQTQDTTTKPEPETQTNTLMNLKVIRMLMIISECRHCLSPFMVIVYKSGHGADLDGVGVVGRVLKQTIIRVKQLPGNQEEELSGGSAVVQPATYTQNKCRLST